SIAVIVNPAAGPRGRRAGHRRVAVAEGALAQRAAQGSVHLTEGPGHAFELASPAVAARATLVCAWGGDGPGNEARPGRGGATALGIVPPGPGTGPARELGLPGDPAQALRAALGRRERVTDVGDAGGRLFVNLCGIGLDAQVAARFNARPGRRRGLTPYITIGVREILRYRAREYAIRAGGETWTERALAVVCANARQDGGGAGGSSRRRRAPTTGSSSSSRWRRARRWWRCGTRSTCSGARWTGRPASARRAPRPSRSGARSPSSSTWTGRRSPAASPSRCG